MDQDFLDALNSVKSRWNEAEEAIKVAEQLHGKVVTPAISELRYGGRRMVDSLTMYERDKSTAILYAKECEFFCCRAQHDAVDACMIVFGGYIDRLLEVLPPKYALEALNNGLRDHIEKVNEAEELIQQTRKDRELRNALYDSFNDEKPHDSISETERKVEEYVKISDNIDLKGLIKSHQSCKTDGELQEQQAIAEQEEQNLKVQQLETQNRNLETQNRNLEKQNFHNMIIAAATVFAAIAAYLVLI